VSASRWLEEPKSYKDRFISIHLYIFVQRRRRRGRRRRT
jgi:hypothetical protein